LKCADACTVQVVRVPQRPVQLPEVRCAGGQGAAAADALLPAAAPCHPAITGPSHASHHAPPRNNELVGGLLRLLRRGRGQGQLMLTTRPAPVLCSWRVLGLLPVAGRRQQRPDGEGTLGAQAAAHACTPHWAAFRDPRPFYHMLWPALLLVLWRNPTQGSPHAGTSRRARHRSSHPLVTGPLPGSHLDTVGWRCSW
jgi:hypothetical protein